MKKIYWIILLVLAILAIFLFWRTTKTNARISQCKQENAECQKNDSDHPCCQGFYCKPHNIHSDNGKCEPNVTPTPTPKVTPTPTITVTPTPPCNDDCGTPTLTPTPTPTETITPTSFQVESNQDHSGSVSAPICTDDGIPQYKPEVTKAWRDGKGNVDVTWTHTDPINEYIVYFGLTGKNLDWNTGRLSSWETSLHFTPASAILDVEVCAVSKCGAENCSLRFIDP